jgi:hypothetical protein
VTTPRSHTARVVPPSPLTAANPSTRISPVKEGCKIAKRTVNPVSLTTRPPPLRKRASMPQTMPSSPNSRGSVTHLSRSVSSTVPIAPAGLQVFSPSPQHSASGDLCKPRCVQEVITTPEVEKGAADVAKRRVVMCTRFAARAGADRQVGPRLVLSIDGRCTSARPTSTPYLSLPRLDACRLPEPGQPHVPSLGC